MSFKLDFISPVDVQLGKAPVEVFDVVTEVKHSQSHVSAFFSPYARLPNRKFLGVVGHGNEFNIKSRGRNATVAIPAGTCRLGDLGDFRRTQDEYRTLGNAA